ncbi:MAG: hypothetical protein COW03_06610 [Cytophagales bacterium CG12_big_fil_rev_8_21_14_0_65_40_12]|nr:MAG: hypothetical protein COW03_06610 [Cytophagales bacterium CG12_big_fil_rev_8_21_14_0_65_40_12]PIW03314.1 MAG: hypothetical protein COW40_15765 [Cytophagales bacterium CG17_big_fil_post_rev_8_21_14_2_50_40_13]
MKRILVYFLLFIFAVSCHKEEDPVTINSLGQVKLDNYSSGNDRSGLGALVVSHEGSKIYYAINNYEASRFEMRMIDASGEVKKLFSGEGIIQALDISDDDNKLLYSTSRDYEGQRTAKLYEFTLDTEIAGLTLSVTGDGSIWNSQYLPDGDVIYTQGDGLVHVSLRRMNIALKEVTVLLEKSENPLLIDIDKTGGKLLLQGWSNSRIMTLNFDGTDLRDYGQQIIQIGPISFSPDGSEILASEIFNPQQTNGLAYNGAVSYNIETGEKSILTPEKKDNVPFGYGKNLNELILNVRDGAGTQGELSVFNKELNTYERLTNNDQYEIFYGFYGNSTDRILFIARNENSSALYIYNR